MDALTSSLGMSGNSTMPAALDEGMDRQSCALLGSTGLIVQGLMAAMVLSTLLLKRLKEHPKRTWPVWTADVGKQIIGQAYLHASNVLISTLVSHHERRDACTAYFLSILVDCTLGVLVIFATLKVISYLLITRLHLSGFRSGQYYDNVEKPDSSRRHGDLEAEEDEEEVVVQQSQRSSHFQFSWWGKQTLIYLASLTTMKLTILGFFWIPQIFTVGDWVLSWMGDNFRVVFVLMIFPLIMNAFQVRRRNTVLRDSTAHFVCPVQFLVIDTILKSPHHKAPASAFADQASKQEDISNSRHRGNDGDDDENQAFLSNTHAAEEDESLLAGDRQGETKKGEILPTYRQSPSTTKGPGLSRPTRLSSRLEETKDARLPPQSNASPASPPSRALPVSSSLSKSQTIIVPSATLVPSPAPEEDEKADEQGWDWLDEDEDSLSKEDAFDGPTEPVQTRSDIETSRSNNEKFGIGTDYQSSNFVPSAQQTRIIPSM
jgi:hypothetical protein